MSTQRPFLYDAVDAGVDRLGHPARAVDGRADVVRELLPARLPRLRAGRGGRPGRARGRGVLAAAAGDEHRATARRSASSCHDPNRVAACSRSMSAASTPARSSAAEILARRRRGSVRSRASRREHRRAARARAPRRPDSSWSGERRTISGIELREHPLQLVLVADLDHALEAERACLAVALDERVFALAGDEQPAVGAGRRRPRRAMPPRTATGRTSSAGTAPEGRATATASAATSARAAACGADLDEDRDPVSLGDRLAQATPVGHARRS